MKKILVLSVGGSAEPVINAIKNNDPDFVYFLCSSGQKGNEKMIDSPGDPCDDKRRSKCPECGHECNMGNPKGEAIVFQAGLDKGRYETVNIDDPDDLNGCYQRLLGGFGRDRVEIGDGSVASEKYFMKLAIPSRPPKTGGGNRQHAAAELNFINMEKCNFFHEKIEAIAKHYFYKSLIYFKGLFRDSNCKIKALKCFSINQHAVTWGEKRRDPF